MWRSSPPRRRRSSSTAGNTGDPHLRDITRRSSSRSTLYDTVPANGREHLSRRHVRELSIARCGGWLSNARYQPVTYERFPLYVHPAADCDAIIPPIPSGAHALRSEIQSRRLTGAHCPADGTDTDRSGPTHLLPDAPHPSVIWPAMNAPRLVWITDKEPGIWVRPKKY